MDVAARFWPRVVKGNGCWLWQGALDGGGYGRIRAHIKGAYRMALVHRVAYELLVGPIPDGLTIDHTCHNGDLGCPGGVGCLHRRCVNPEHLEPTTGRVNTLRSHTQRTAINAKKTHCPKGHPLDGFSGNQRYCRECNRKGTRERQMAQRRAAGIPAGRGIREKMRTHCPQGHPYDDANTRISPQGHRVCRTCERNRRRERDRRRVRVKPGTP